MTRITFYFQDIISSYNDWYEKISKNIIGENADGTEQAFDMWAYNLLKRYFFNQNVRYNEPEAFIEMLINVYTNRFKQFYKQKQLIDKIYQLTDNEILIVSKGLSNYANNPNTAPDDPTQPLNFVTSQSYSQITDNKLKAYLDSINRVPTLRVDEFIKGRNEYFDEISFTDLFMNLQLDIYNIYGG